MLFRVFLTILILGPCTTFSSAMAADAWQPAKVPLMTRWGKALTADNVLPEYPRPQMVRPTWQNLNGLWDYAVTGKDDSAPKTFQGKILVPFPIESALSGVRKSFEGANRLWYRRGFQTSATAASSRTLLHFGAVDWETTVSVNGKQVGTHRGGFDPFTCDITDALTSEGSQELLVSVLDATGGGGQAKGKQTTGNLDALGTLAYSAASGIWQTVWLETVPQASIDQLKIVPDLDAGAARLTVVGRGCSDADTIEAVVLDENREVARVGGKVGAEIILPIPHPKLWSPDSPFLYDLRVTLRRAGQSDDCVTSYFGMRKIALGKDAEGNVRMMLNGNPVFQIGPLDQGYWPDGIFTAPSDEALRYDLQWTKKLGFNATRKHVKVEPDRWYYWCDRLGLLVWQDMPSGGGGTSPEAARQFEVELSAMVLGLSNHPSVVMWVIFNEGWGQYDTARLTETVRRLDPHRLINSVSCIDKDGNGDIIDDHPYWVPQTPKADGRRALVLGEFGGRAMVIPGHVISETKVFGHPGGTILASPWEWSTQYIKLVRKVYEEKEKNGLSGAICTQLTDIEGECNGFLTYDREVVKVELDRVAAANRGQLPPPPQFRVLAPTAEKDPVSWRYTFDKPADGWLKSDFDDSVWKEGPGGFGKGNWRTQWTTEEIWLRREFTLDADMPKMPELLAHHDRFAEVYINGVLAAKMSGYTIEYQEFEIRPEARKALKPGRNVLSVHCRRDSNGGQYIDVGVVDPKKIVDKP